MALIKVELFDEIEMKKPHPCVHHSHRFQVVMLGADLKLQCLGCGNIVLISRIKFNQKFKKHIASHEALIFNK
ncbi:MAG: hypothetical protein BWX57_00224 [Tenericutes bacterium ADurb.Bin024]|nr:MAG: hypothetical protein BWX57_00224 [Tenericutes bacterium ADurb.Bin024]